MATHHGLPSLVAGTGGIGKMPAMVRVTLFTKQACCLCDTARFVLERVRTRAPFELEVVDISAPGCEVWLAEYADHIPVVHVDGREVCRHRIDEKRIREAVTSAATATG